jgi:hypothetical protein
MRARMIEPPLARPAVAGALHGIREVAGVGTEVLPRPGAQVADNRPARVVQNKHGVGRHLVVDVVHLDVDRRVDRVLELPLPARDRVGRPTAHAGHRVGKGPGCDRRVRRCARGRHRDAGQCGGKRQYRDDPRPMTHEPGIGHEAPGPEPVQTGSTMPRALLSARAASVSRRLNASSVLVRGWFSTASPHGNQKR